MSKYYKAKTRSVGVLQYRKYILARNGENPVRTFGEKVKS
jgi:hypothetical protein